MRSFTAVVSGEVVQHAKVGPMLVSKEPHVQPVERGEVPPKHMSQLKLRNGGGRPFGGMRGGQRRPLRPGGAGGC